jgi:hypothetical protein
VKLRQIRVTKMAADISLEQRRSELLAERSANDRVEADTKAYALSATLQPVRDIDWKTLLAMSGSGSDPRLMIALAFREMAENADKIGSLMVTPDLLTQLMVAPAEAPATAKPTKSGAR